VAEWEGQRRGSDCGGERGDKRRKRLANMTGDKVCEQSVRLAIGAGTTPALRVTGSPWCYL